MMGGTRALKGALKVTLVTETFPPEVNGVAFTLAQIAKGFSAMGHFIEVAKPAPSEKSSKKNPWREIHLPSKPIPGYANLRFGLPCGSLLRKHWSNGRNRPDLVYLATEGPSGLSALRTCQMLGIPVVSGYHTNFDEYARHYHLGPLKHLVESYLRWFHNNTLATFAPSDWMIERLRQMGYKNLNLFGRGVDTKIFNPVHRSAELRNSWGIKEEGRVLLTACRVAAEKNLDLTCSLFRRELLRGSVGACIVAGDGPEKERLSREYPEIHFPGCLSKEELARYYASADLFLFSSATETFGNVVTEALSSGLPVVAYDYAAPRQYISEGKNGFLAPFGDAERLGSKLETAINLSSMDFQALGTQALKVTNKLDWKEVLLKLELDMRSAVETQGLDDLRESPAINQAA